MSLFGMAIVAGGLDMYIIRIFNEYTSKWFQHIWWTIWLQIPILARPVINGGDGINK